jgi:phosphatidylserine/phosphatidylglycerophosphate/cardiolipin synthase-like enzyme
MDVLRGRILEGLRKADVHGRFRVYYPRGAESPHCALMVHAKIMVIDDDFVRVGSSTLSNRSMGLDSECYLAVAAGTSDAVRSAIVCFRNRLLAEHLGAEARDVAAAVEAGRSLIEAVESLRTGGRTLMPLSEEVPPEIDRWVPESSLLDPEKPVAPDELFDYFVSPEQQPFAYRHPLKVILLVAGVILMAALWRWSPAGDWIDVASVRAAGEWVRRQPLSPLWVPGARTFPTMFWRWSGLR